MVRVSCKCRDAWKENKETVTGREEDNFGKPSDPADVRQDLQKILRSGSVLLGNIVPEDIATRSNSMEIWLAGRRDLLPYLDSIVDASHLGWLAFATTMAYFCHSGRCDLLDTLHEFRFWAHVSNA